MFLLWRTVVQLRNLWANIKAGQRNILTKERQARLATGGGPEEKTCEIDSDIALVAPNLLEMASMLFSCDVRSWNTWCVIISDINPIFMYIYCFN